MCIAAQEGHVECVRVLLEWGANPTHSDRCGRTPMRVALKSGHASISRLLEEATLARSKTSMFLVVKVFILAFQVSDAVMCNNGDAFVCLCVRLFEIVSAGRSDLLSWMGSVC